MKTPSCCIFHSQGGPDAFPCEDYGRRGDEGADASAIDFDFEPQVRVADLLEWDVYAVADSDAELASALNDTREEFFAE